MCYACAMPLTREALGLPTTNTIWYHDERLLVVDDTPEGDKVLVVIYATKQPDTNAPLFDQVIAHFNAAGMHHICDQGVIQVADMDFPYAVFCE